jgi:hypothetical protein
MNDTFFIPYAVIAEYILIMSVVWLLGKVFERTPLKRVYKAISLLDNGLLMLLGSWIMIAITIRLGETTVAIYRETPLDCCMITAILVLAVICLPLGRKRRY